MFQAGDVAADAPPIVGLGGALIFYAFLVVMLVVPWIMARESTDDTPAGLGQDSADPSASRFSSAKERRLWIWTGIVIVAIYSTLGPIEVLAAALRERNLLRLTSAVVLALVVAVMAVPWLKRRPGRREIGAAIGIAAVYLTTLIRLPVPEARSHLFEYGLVAMLIYQALTERRRNGRSVSIPAVTAFVATALLGWLDEGIQLFLPNRVYDLVDVGFNAIAAFMAISASVFMAWAQKWDIMSRLRRKSE